MQDKKLKLFNKQKLTSVLKEEDRFVAILLESLPKKQQSEDEEIAVKSIQKQNGNKASNKPSSARTLSDLKSKLAEITSKKKLSYKEKLNRKSVKAKIKKKDKKQKRKLVQNGQQSESALKQESEDVEVKVPQQEEKMAFSNFEFPEVRKKRKQTTDPQKVMERLQKNKEKIEQLKEVGELGKAVKIKEKIAWKNALARAEGEKVKDDPILLKKSMKKKEQLQRRSKKKWTDREEGVKKAKEDRQKKRQGNLDKRKQGNKLKKMKIKVKRGKVIPGL